MDFKMAGFLYNLLLMSAGGTVMFFIAAFLFRHTKGKYGRWYYALLVTSVLMFIVPFNIFIKIPIIMII